MIYTDNPVKDAERYYEQLEQELEKLPRCSCCDEPITDEYCYMVNDEPVCESCMDSYYRVSVDDLI